MADVYATHSAWPFILYARRDVCSPLSFPLRKGKDTPLYDSRLDLEFLPSILTKHMF